MNHPTFDNNNNNNDNLSVKNIIDLVLDPSAETVPLARTITSEQSEIFPLKRKNTRTQHQLLPPKTEDSDIAMLSHSDTVTAIDGATVEQSDGPVAMPLSSTADLSDAMIISKTANPAKSLVKRTDDSSVDTSSDLSKKKALLPLSAKNSEVGRGKQLRNRRAFSCDTCRRRKVKCDQRRPQCGSCIHRNSTCVYGAAEVGAFVAVLRTFTKKIQRRKKTQLLLLADKKTASLTTKSNELNTSDLSSTDQSILNNAFGKKTLPLPSPTAGQYAMYSDSQLATSTTNPQIQKCVDLPNSPPESPTVHPVADEWNKKHSYIALTSMLSLTTDKQLPSPMLSATTPEYEAENPTEYELNLTAVTKRREQTNTWIFVLENAILNPSLSMLPVGSPDPIIVQHLVTLYVQRIHPQHPMFSLQWLSGIIRSKSIPLGLLTAMMALGARFSNKLARSTEISKLLHNQARLFLQQNIDNFDLTTAQTAILISIYLFIEGNGPMSFACQSLAYRLVEAMHTSIRTPSKNHADKMFTALGMSRSRYEELHHETWRRTWWYLYILNRISGSRTGQAFGKRITGVPMPTQEIDDMQNYPEFNGPVQESVSMDSKLQIENSILKRFRYDSSFKLAILLERVVLFVRQSASWSSNTSQQNENLIRQQRILQYEWCLEAKSLATFREIYNQLTALKTDRLSKRSIDKIGTPKVVTQPLPTLAAPALPTMTVQDETQTVSAKLSAILYSVFLHAFHRTILIQLMSPPMPTSMQSLQSSEYESIYALFDERFIKTTRITKLADTIKEEVDNTTCNKTNKSPKSPPLNLEQLSTCLGAALEISRIAECIPLDTIAIMHGYYQQCIGITADVFLNILENETAWQLLDPISSITRFAHCADTLGQYSRYYAMAELNRVNMVSRFWEKCQPAIQHAYTTPGGAQLLQSPALQRTQYPGTMWDPNIIASFGIYMLC
ncbi:hypothetical protein BDF19DRAFT_65830 [Syncephalis fuscata]|nr:hypothetical protein BDF19DRAFT_65830 [Syncephalis fuscata]